MVKKTYNKKTYNKKTYALLVRINKKKNKKQIGGNDYDSDLHKILIDKNIKSFYINDNGIKIADIFKNTSEITEISPEISYENKKYILYTTKKANLKALQLKKIENTKWYKTFYEEELKRLKDLISNDEDLFPMKFDIKDRKNNWIIKIKNNTEFNNKDLLYDELYNMVSNLQAPILTGPPKPPTNSQPAATAAPATPGGWDKSVNKYGKVHWGKKSNSQPPTSSTNSQPPTNSQPSTNSQPQTSSTNSQPPPPPTNSQPSTNSQPQTATTGGKKKSKKTRKHRGIIQIGGNTGRLRKGYKYSGKRLKNGMPEILKIK